MTCSDVLGQVEAIAAGDEAPTPEVRAHVETCVRCAAALAAARRIEAALSARQAPNAPARFTATVQQRIRGERWQTEQHIDRVFNLAMVAALVLVVGGLFALMNVGGLLAGAGNAWAMIRSVSGPMARMAAPQVNGYIAAAALLISALAMWWWAERTLSL
jgi:anti-sigma factor RsiW